MSRRKGVKVESNEGLQLLRAERSDRYKIRLRIGDSIVSLYFAWDWLAPLTKVDLTPDAPNPPWRVLPEEGHPDDVAWDESHSGEDVNRRGAT